MTATGTIRRPNLSRDKAAARQAKAVAFLRRLGKDAEADALEREPLQHYAMRKGILLENPQRKRNLFGFGGGRKVVSADEVRELQKDAAESHCRHGDYQLAQKTARQSPRSFARARGMKLEGPVHRAKQRVKHAAGSKLSELAKRLMSNPDRSAHGLSIYGGPAQVPEAWYRLSVEALGILRRALLDDRFYRRESPDAAAGRQALDIDALDQALEDAKRPGARIFVAHDAAGWYFAREVDAQGGRRGNPVAGIEFVIGRPQGRTTTEVESVLFDRSKWTVAAAQRWLRANGFSAPAAEQVGARSHQLRFRQQPLSDFQAGSFRTIAAGRRRGRGRRNPDGDGDLDQAAKLFSDFQGRQPQEVLELQRQDVQRKDYAKLGDLVSLTVLGPREREYKLDFAAGDDVIVASSANAKQLYLLGGNQDIRPMLADLDCDASKDFVEVGPCVEIEYFTHKALDQFQPIRYYHRFGEETKEVPVLAFDQLNLQLLLIGGAYEVKPEGITN